MATANQLYRQYKKEGGTLPFKQWIDREYKKGFLNATGEPNVPFNKPLNDSIHRTLEQMHRQSGYQDEVSKKYILGINKNVLIITGVVAALGIGYVIYQKVKK